MSLNEEIGIYVCLPKDIFVYCQELLKSIEAFNSDASKIKSHFHITLYQGSVKKEDLKTVFEKVQSLLEFQKQFEISFKPEMNVVGKNIFLEAHKSQQIDNLHQQIVQAISPLKASILKQFQDLNFENLQENTTLHDIKSYGMANVFERYNPHVTIAYQVDIQALPVAIAKVKPSRFNVSSIGIGKIGFYGNVTEQIKSFDLREEK